MLKLLVEVERELYIYPKKKLEGKFIVNHLFHGCIIDFFLGWGGEGQKFLLKGPICDNNLSIQTFIHIHKHIHLYTYTEISIFHNEIFKIKCFIELN